MMDELEYFNMRGRAETARLLYKISGKQFIDTRHPFPPTANWADAKKDLPFGQLPVLKRGDVMISQSMAIARFIARETDQVGKDGVEKALADAAVDQLESVGNEHILFMFYEKDEARQEQRRADFENTMLPNTLKGLERQIAANPAGFIVGDKMLWCDVHFYVILSRFLDADENVLSPYPGCAALYKKVAETPQVAAWVKERPATPF